MFKPTIAGPPKRASLHRHERVDRLEVVMHEYDAIRGEVETTLSSQVAILSFGAATIGLLVAAAAALWDDQPALTGLTLLLAVPLASFLTLAVYSGELVRLMRAGLFLNRLECTVNRTFAVPKSGCDDCAAEDPTTPDDSLLLTWEQWSNIRSGGADVDRLNRLAIYSVFLFLAAVFGAAGYVRLHTASDIPEIAAAVALFLSASLGLLSVVWLTYLVSFAYSYRKLYRYDSKPETTDGLRLPQSSAVPPAANRAQDEDPPRRLRAKGDTAGAGRVR
jgi:hypothetical protein